MACDDVDSSVLDVKKGIVKAKMLTGVYNLQQQRTKLSKIPTDPKFNLCRLTVKRKKTWCILLLDVQFSKRNG